jgi:hypothetical protein
MPRRRNSTDALRGFVVPELAWEIQAAGLDLVEEAVLHQSLVLQLAYSISATSATTSISLEL